MTVRAFNFIVDFNIHKTQCARAICICIIYCIYIKYYEKTNATEITKQKRKIINISNELCVILLKRKIKII